MHSTIIIESPSKLPTFSSKITVQCPLRIPIYKQYYYIIFSDSDAPCMVRIVLSTLGQICQQLSVAGNRCHFVSTKPSRIVTSTRKTNFSFQNSLAETLSAKKNY